MSLKDWLFNLTKRDEYLEVEGNSFNPSKELFNTLKDRVSDLLQVIEVKDNEIELLRRENLSLKEKIIQAPPVKQAPPRKHFVTVSAAKSELEKMSREELKRQKLESKNRSTI